VISKASDSEDAQRGFTLLEVLVALAVLSISLGILLPVFSDTLQRQTAVADRRTANMLAQSKLDEIGSEIKLRDGASDGTFANGFTWHLEIVPYDFDRTSVLVTPKLVTLTVRWPAKNGPGVLTVRTIKLAGHE